MKVIKIFNQFYKKYGAQHWWPVSNKSPDKIFEICIGAILTQNTTWANVEKVLKLLLKANLLKPKEIIKCPISKLQKLVRSAGYYKQKAKKLKIFSRWIVKKYQGRWQHFFSQPLKKAREELLFLWGIGPETADSILLYAGHKPIFVIDAYTKRLCRKHGVEFKTYDEYREFFEKRLKNKERIAIFQEYHALIVKWGKENRKDRDIF